MRYAIRSVPRLLRMRGGSLVNKFDVFELAGFRITAVAKAGERYANALHPSQTVSSRGLCKAI